MQAFRAEWKSHATSRPCPLSGSDIFGGEVDEIVLAGPAMPGTQPCAAGHLLAFPTALSPQDLPPSAQVQQWTIAVTSTRGPVMGGRKSHVGSCCGLGRAGVLDSGDINWCRECWVVPAYFQVSYTEEGRILVLDGSRRLYCSYPSVKDAVANALLVIPAGIRSPGLSSHVPETVESSPYQPARLLVPGAAVWLLGFSDTKSDPKTDEDLHSWAPCVSVRYLLINTRSLSWQLMLLHGQTSARVGLSGPLLPTALSARPGSLRPMPLGPCPSRSGAVCGCDGPWSPLEIQLAPFRSSISDTPIAALALAGELRRVGLRHLTPHRPAVLPEPRPEIDQDLYSSGCTCLDNCSSVCIGPRFGKGTQEARYSAQMSFGHPGRMALLL